MIVLMAGLPGTGKSAVARRLAERLPAALLDKDRVRDALFAPGLVEYSARQDDFCIDLMLATAAYLLGNGAVDHVILDGRTFSRAAQVEHVEAFAGKERTPVRIIECVCSESTAHGRLAVDAATGKHPAQNRDNALYKALKARYQPIRDPKLVLDTEQSLSDCVEHSLAFLCTRTLPAGEHVGP